MNERGGNPLERHRHDDEDAGFEVGRRIEARPAGIKLAVRPAREQIRDRCDQHEKVADRLSLIERVRQHGDEQRCDHAAVAEPEYQHIDQQDIEQRQHVDEPPTVPATLVDQPDHRVDHGGAA
ncbi:MAG: hypothetical protein DMD59_03835 [Gemmatimonadetes bacterium]|nr:MAG: hypothetical protein DMD59_03835 [Gemmatimonadota bacterium]